MPIVAILGEVLPQHASAIRATSAADPTGTLTILVSSQGGATDAALAAADAIAAHRRGRTVGRAVRACHSASIAILCACDERRARIGTTFEFHGTAPLRPLAGRMTAPRLRQLADGLAATDATFRQRIAAATGTPVSQIAHLEENNVVLDTLEALNIGLLTEITGYPALSAAAARQRSARDEARRPVVWTAAERRQMRELGLTERVLGIAPRALRVMLRQGRA
ncbi:MAG TPA: ATP-dependent Clp protease proteolytic subunit [Stellaceae bacterium]|nr:ATP-dependent Clp protease proteolytic subunit [Stellaceae bacterium]